MAKEPVRKPGAGKVKPETAKVGPQPNGEGAAVGGKDPSGDVQGVADGVVLCLLIINVIRTAEEYPGAMPAWEHKAWIAELSGELDEIFQRPGFEGFRKYREVSAAVTANFQVEARELMTLLMRWHPSWGKPGESEAAAIETVTRVRAACRRRASPQIEKHEKRLVYWMIESCRCPTGTDSTEFNDPRRAVQLLERYWGLGRSLVLTRTKYGMDFSPHPLLIVIENLRDRLKDCFRNIGPGGDAAAVQESCEQLLLSLAEGHVDDLLAAQDWVDAELQRIDLFIARSRLNSGGRLFELTEAETVFIAQIEPLISDHDRNVRRERGRLFGPAPRETEALTPGAGGSTDRKQEAAANEGQATESPLTLVRAELLVLRAMAVYGAEKLLSIPDIRGEMKSGSELSEPSIGKAVTSLIKQGLAERPQGSRLGARLKPEGRRLARLYEE